MSFFDFKKLYGVGNHLKDYSKQEKYQRCSISCYYYSIFDSVKDYYEKSFRKTLPSKNGHSILIKSLESPPFDEEKN